ncbi:MAG: Hsp20/alpha crystallin family protein [Myxococcota bacterium]
MTQLDETIAQVERLYRNVTGQDPPSAATPYAPIPPEKNPQQHVEEQMERLSALLGQPVGSSSATPTLTPPITVAESAQETLVCVDLPGVARDQVAVNVSQGMLLITAQRPTAVPVGDNVQVRHSERPVGSFRRVVPLPPGTAAEQLSAELSDGVLVIHVPRGTAAHRSVPVQ